MKKVVLSNLVKTFGDLAAVRLAGLEIEDGELLALLGPSGCGKTTTLRCIAGLDTPEDGEIRVGGRCLFSASRRIDLPPRERDVGLVFQNYALYPHMTVAQNIAFGLKTRRLPRETIDRRVREALELLELGGLERRYPRQLSGGQQQRVAVARMIVTRPALLLFDEPFSNLDAPLRAQVRAEVRRMHRRLGATSIFVTHDQTDAMILADRIAVMEEGAIRQIGTPREIYHFPASTFVAEFTGNPKTNLLAGCIRRFGGRTALAPEIAPGRALVLPAAPPLAPDQPVILNVRPEDVELEIHPLPDELQLPIYARLPSGPESLVYLRAEGSRPELVARDRRTAPEALAAGRRVGIRLRRGNLYDRATERLLGSFGHG